MNNPDKSPDIGLQSASRSPAYSTFPHVTTHGPRDKRCFHGKPEDWKRVNVKRTFGGKVK
jgi:hypothetical protein